jgi:hypothetical protein
LTSWFLVIGRTGENRSTRALGGQVQDFMLESPAVKRWFFYFFYFFPCLLAEGTG